MWVTAKESMKQAFSLQDSSGDHVPRALPWAGMKDAFSVFQPSYGFCAQLQTPKNSVLRPSSARQNKSSLDARRRALVDSSGTTKNPIATMENTARGTTTDFVNPKNRPTNRIEGGLIGHCAALLLGYSLLFGSIITGRAAVVKIGNTTVDLPPPDQYVDCSQEDDPVRKLCESFCPAGNKLLCVFTSPDFRRAVVAGEPRGGFDYTLVEVLRGLISNNVSPSYFAQVKTATKGEQEALLKKVQPKLKTELDRINSDLKNKGKDINLEIDQPVPLGVFAESNQHLSMAILARMQTKVGEKNKSQTVAVAVNLVNVKGKMLYLYNYCAYDGAASLKQLKEFANAWVAKAEKANGP